MFRSFALATVMAAAVALPSFAQTTPGLDAAVRADQSPEMNFVVSAASSDMFEVESSKVALEKSGREDVKAFAQHMVQDHGMTTDKLKAAATADGVGPFTAPDSKHAQMIKNAQQAKDDHFDATYLSLQVQGHQEAVALFEKYASNGAGANLKAFAAESLPTLKQHLDEAQALSSK